MTKRTPVTTGARGFWSVTVLAMILMTTMLTSTTNNNNNNNLVEAKRLVLFAGPRRAAATSVEEFFHKYAHGWVKGDKAGFALRYWHWPHVEGEETFNPEQPYKVYSNLVLDPKNDDFFNKVVDSAKAALDDAQDGIILGTEYFDQMGKYADYDGMAAMKKLVDALAPEIEPSDVTVVVNYRSPRFEQWESIWRDFVDGTSTTYDEFLCTATEYHKKMELLSTAMNPLQVAQASIDQGWKVDVIDMDGVEKDGMDVSHSVSCDVLLGKCTDDGWTKHHENEAIYNNGSEEGHVISELTKKDKDAAEKLFEARDCAYRKSLSDAPGFRVVRKSSLWKGCHASDGSEDVYQQMLDVELIFRGLLSQMQCEGNPVKLQNMPQSIEEVLSGNYDKGKGFSESKKGGGRKFLFLLTLVGVAGAAFMAHKHPTEAGLLWNRVKVTAREVKVNDVVNSVVVTAQNAGHIVRASLQKQRHTMIPTSSGEAEMESMPVGRSTGMSEML